MSTEFPMQPHEAALAAADTALADLWRHADANRGPDGSINVSTYAMARAVIAAVEPIIRADERAKVAEELNAERLLHRAEGRDVLAIGYGHASRWLAHRQEATQPAVGDAGARTAPPVGSAKGDGHSGAQEAQE